MGRRGDPRDAGITMIRVGLGEGGLDDQLTVLARVLELVREVDGEVGPATSAAAGSRTT